MPFLPFITNLFAQDESVNTNTFQQNQLLLTNFLQNGQNATIRIYVASASGFGHQANTVNIMWSLITAGLNQSIQVIYDPAATVPTTIQKLATLIPGVVDTPGVQNVTISGVAISIISLTDFNNLPPLQKPVLNFGITGGYDEEAINLSVVTNTILFLKLQPYCWKRKTNALYIRNTVTQVTTTINLATVVALGAAAYNKSNYYLPLPQMTQADYLQFSGAYPVKAAAYIAILAACNATANLLPVYGIGDVLGWVESMPTVRPESILFNLIAAVAYTQDFSDVSNLKKGAVIVVIATVSSGCYDNLVEMVTGNNPNTPLVNEYVKGQKLPARVNIVPYNHPRLNDLLAQVQRDPEMILVIKMNGLPGKPFNFLYSKSTLPCMFEGKGTAALVLNLPVPYFNLTEATIVYPTLPLTAAVGPQARDCNVAVIKLNTPFNQTNTSINTNGFDSTAIYALGQFIWKISEDGHPLKVYFDSLPLFYHNLRNDKLLNALFYMLQHVKGLL
jgi:hypothetical protein